MPFSISIQQPAWFALLILLPVMWRLSHRSLQAIGGRRALIANLLRTLVVLGIVAALAAPQWNRYSEKLAVAYLLDQSESIPSEYREKLLHFVTASVSRHRDVAAEDQAAIIVFGRESAVELPPVAFTPRSRRVETLVDQTATNLADALSKAAAVLPRDASRRVVIVSDGNENLGGASHEAQRLLDMGIGIDVVPVPTDAKQDVAVESVSAPAVVARDQPMELRIVLSNQGSDPKPVSGKLRIVRERDKRQETLLEQQVTLPVGKSVKTMREVPQESDFYVYKAQFVPDVPTLDRFAENNTAAAFTDVRGKGRVLLIEDALYPGEFDHLIETLRSQGLEIDVRKSDRAFSSLADLQRYDSVVLANLPRVSGTDNGAEAGLSDEQIDMLVQNTGKLGSGLVMLGGDRSFGAGGWIGTELEKAMPVDFKIDNAKVVPSGALALVIDRSGSMAGQKLSMSLAAAREAAKMLGPRDFLSVVCFDSAPHRVVPLQRKGTGRAALELISRIGQGGGTDLYPGMAMAFRELQGAEAAVKHMIVLTDGQTPEAEFTKLCREIRSQNITVTCVAIGPDADRNLLAKIASVGGGKFYAVANLRALPRIFMVETRRVTTPVIRELKPPLAPEQVGSSSLLAGIDGGFPPISGFIQTSLKENSLVEQLLRSPVPVIEKNSTILATWNYGIGKSAVFTTDAGGRWAANWQEWESYGKFFTQLMRWSLRSQAAQGNYSLAVQIRDQHAEVTLNALDEEQFASSLGSLAGTAVGPNLKAAGFLLEHIAPGRYVGKFETLDPGSYFISVATPEGALLRTGVNASVSREYRDFLANLALLKSMADGKPRGGTSGTLVSAEDQLPFGSLEGDHLALELNPFRRTLAPAVASRDLWPGLVFATCFIFFGDVLVRRVHLDLSSIGSKLQAMTMSTPPSAASATLAGLSKRKAEIRSRQKRAHVPTHPLDEVDDRQRNQPSQAHASGDAPVTAPPAQKPTAENETAEPQSENTMSRLLQAKRSVASKHSPKTSSDRRNPSENQ